MDGIAIIGIGCHLPGAIGPSAFWELLKKGEDKVTTIPQNRWQYADFYSAESKPGRMNTKYGGFITDADLFDAEFFGISPREARLMDPQQRLMLQTTWQAFADANINPTHLSGSKTGVFVGVMGNEWGRIHFQDPELIDIHTGTGNGYCMIANRLSYYFDLRGPCLAVDTACSSSLVAVDLACKSLWSGEATLAVAGGVNLILTSGLNIFYTQAGLSAPDGRCKPFSSKADGIGRGEGAGVVVLKPLAKAIADNDRIYAVIKGTAINHDGRSNGITAPNRWAQEEVLRQAYQNAAISPTSVQYIEAHGTGTLLGDPIETKALGTVISKMRPADQPCFIGSVKGNFGHLEGAAGIAGLIKLALAIKKQQIPPSLHANIGNPHINFEKLQLRIAQKLESWPTYDGKIVAGISAFGLGGTNAHMVLENALDKDSESQTFSFVPVKNFNGQSYWFNQSAIKLPQNEVVKTKLLPQETEIENNIIEIISRVSEIDKSKIGLSSDVNKELGFDSIMVIEMKSLIEESYPKARKITLQDIVKITTVKSIIELVLATNAEDILV